MYIYLINAIKELELYMSYIYKYTREEIYNHLNLLKFYFLYFAYISIFAYKYKYVYHFGVDFWLSN